MSSEGPRSMYRDTWTFPYRAIDLAGAAGKCADYHRERVAFWTKEHATAEAALRKKGMEVRSVPATGGERMQVVLDPARQARLEECRSKLSGHERQEREYTRWRRIFEAASKSTHPATYQLTVSDAEYFDL